MKLQTTIAIAALAFCMSACGSKPATTTSATPSVSLSPNDVAPSAAKAYRQALDRSLAASQSMGLTELWKDATGSLVTVLVESPNDGICVQSDLVIKDTQLIDQEAMMPSVLIAELDGLEANSGSDIGSVKFATNGDIEVANFIDDTHYVTTYALDQGGRISSATQFAEGELAATASFRYEVTPDGQKALDAAGN